MRKNYKTARKFINKHLGWMAVVLGIPASLIAVWSVVPSNGSGSSGTEKEAGASSSAKGALFRDATFELSLVAYRHARASGVGHADFVMKNRSKAPLKIAIKSRDARDFASNRAYVRVISSDAQKCWTWNKDITGFAVATRSSIETNNQFSDLSPNKQRRFSIAFRCAAGKKLTASVIYVSFLIYDRHSRRAREVSAHVKAK